MALGLTELIVEVKSALGREDDTTLITDARVMRWLNLAQRDLAEKIAGLESLDFKNTTSVDFTAGKLEYPLSDWTSSLTSNVAGDDGTTTNRICHVYKAFYVDGSGTSYEMQFMPQDAFDSHYIDPTDPNYVWGQPEYYTRRKGNLEIFPVCSTEEDGVAFRLDGSLYPSDFTAEDSTAQSSLNEADDILIAYAVYKASAYIGDGETAASWFGVYSGLKDDYSTQTYKLTEWDANIYGPWIA
jgi:hypothetical protein